MHRYKRRGSVRNKLSSLFMYVWIYVYPGALASLYVNKKIEGK